MPSQTASKAKHSPFSHWNSELRQAFLAFVCDFVFIAAVMKHKTREQFVFMFAFLFGLFLYNNSGEVFFVCMQESEVLRDAIYKYKKERKKVVMKC